MSKIELLIAELQHPSRMRLYMGELNAAELLVAKSAVRYTVSQLAMRQMLDDEKIGNVPEIKE